MSAEPHILGLQDLHEDAHALSLEGFKQKHGDAFLMRSRGSGALTPARPLEGTHSGASASSRAAASPAVSQSQQETVPGLLPTRSEVDVMIFPVRHTERSLSATKRTVGRTRNNDVVIDDQSVSKLHAVFTVGEGGYSLRDAGSTAGTFVNGDPVSPSALLESGDEVCFGAVALTFLTADALVDFVRRIVPRGAKRG